MAEAAAAATTATVTTAVAAATTATAAGAAAGEAGERGREQGKGLVVRNTFIDVCPLEEASDGDSSCPSPMRRNASAPPSPTRKRQGDPDGFDQEKPEDGPDAIPNYEWNAAAAVLAAGGSAGKDEANASHAQGYSLAVSGTVVGTEGEVTDYGFDAGGAEAAAYSSRGRGCRGGWDDEAGGYDRDSLWQDDSAPTCQAVLTHQDGPGVAWPSSRDVYSSVYPHAPHAYAGAYGDFPPREGCGATENPAYIFGGAGVAAGSGATIAPNAAPVLASQPLPMHSGCDAGGRQVYGMPVTEYDGRFGTAPVVHGAHGSVGKGGRGGGRGGRGRGRGCHGGCGMGYGDGPAPWAAAAAVHMPWLVPQSEQGYGDHARPSKGGKGDYGGSGGGCGATRVPLSGGGPKRTDYQAKFAKESEPVPITTMMLKNIPCRKSQEEVMGHIDNNSFAGKYDFFYLPRDVKFRANLGYAFINFNTPEDADAFLRTFHGYQFSGSGSTKACQVVAAHVQGLNNNLAAFKRTEVMRSSRKPYFSTAPDV